MKNAFIIGFCLFLVSFSTQAERVINSVLLNGSTTTSVTAGASVTVEMNVSTSGRGSNDDWDSTSYTINGSTTCVNTSNSSGDGTYTKSFSFIAPLTSGSYTVSFYAHRNGSCSPSRDSNNFSIPNGIVVSAAAPSISIDDISLNAGENANFSVSLTTSYSQDITLNYSTSNGSAVAGTDYTAASGTVTIPEGDTSAIVSVSTSALGSGNFTLSLSNASAGTITDSVATATIIKAASVMLNYRFDECEYTGASSEVIDQTGNYHGISYGNVNTAEQGQVERFVEVSDEDHHIQTSLPLPVNFSVSTWFKKPSSTSGSQYFVLGAMESGGDLLYLDRNENFRWGVYNSSIGSVNGTFLFNSLDDSWHHMALVYSGGQTQLYIDGVLVDSVNIVPSGTLKYIGTSFDGVNGSDPQGFRAPLDEFMVFDSALTLSNIQTIYSNQLANNNYDGTSRDVVTCSSMLGLYQFEQDDFTSQIDDTSGLNNHGTNIGGASISSGKYCRAFDANGTNQGTETNHAFSSNIDLDDDIGVQGSVSFWFNSNTQWSQGGYNGGERILFDATLATNTSGGNKYFALEILNTGYLRFAFEDSNDSDFKLNEPTSSIRDADTWYYLTTTWDFTNDNFQLYIDGNIIASGNFNTNGQVEDLGDIIFGDNATVYASNNNASLPSRTSSNGKFDEVRVYKKVLTQAEIQADMAEGTDCGAIAKWQMDELSWSGTAGEVIDETGNFNAQSKGGASTGRSSPALVGNPGTCGYGVFDGVDDYIEIPDDPRLDLETELTITTWIKPDSLPTSDLKTILSKDENYEFHLNTSGEILWWWSASSFTTSGANISAGNWYHVAITYKSGQQYIYINGVEKGSHTYAGNLPLNSDPLQIGQDQFYGNRYFSGNIDEVQIYGRALTISEINEIYNETHPCDVYLDHFEINHDGNGLTCDAETITIKACADASCSTLNTDDNDVELSINGTVNQTVTVSGGSTNASFSYTDVGTATLSLDQTYTCKNGGSTSCELIFADAGFRFLYGTAEATSIDNQISGDEFSDVVKLQAVEDVNGVCDGLFTGNVDVELAQQNVNPNGTSGLSFKVNGVSGTSIGKYPSYTGNVTLNFDGDSKATIPAPVYLDAGQIRLYAKYSAANVSLVGNSNDFWVSPSELLISAQAAGDDIDGNTHDATTKHKAGQDFDFTVTAVNSQGDITENYFPNDIGLLVARISPVTGGVDGSFNYGTGSLSSALSPTYQSITLSAFVEGVSSTNSASFSEVGLLNVDIHDVDYGFSGNTINADAINIGRFYPDHFDVTITSNSFVDACLTGASDFTYIGQPFTYLNAPELTITAKNTLGITTQNYTHADYQKLQASDINRTFPLEDTTKNGTDDATKMTVSATTSEGVLSTSTTTPASSLGVMTYTFNDSDSFTYDKNANSLVGEFTTAYDIVVNSIEDSDNANASISLASNLPSSNTVSPMGVNLRFGRWIIENTFGPERSDLPLPMATQYYDGSSFKTNTLDNCTVYDGDNDANHSLTVSDLTNPLSATNLTPVSGIGSFVLGLGELVIGQTTDGSQGQIRISYDATPTWLKYDWDGDGEYDNDPTAVATFGIFRGNDRIIYQREVHN